MTDGLTVHASAFGFVRAVLQDQAARSEGSHFTLSSGALLNLGETSIPRIADERDLLEYMLAIANEIGSSDVPSIRSELSKTWRGFLQTVVSDRAKAARQLFAHSADALNSIWMVPYFRWTTRGVSLEHHTVLLNIEALDAYVSVLLLDDQRPFGRDLRQCELNSCNKFFLVRRPPIGRPQTKYCCAKHMRQAHSLASTARANKSRALKKSRKPK